VPSKQAVAGSSPVSPLQYGHYLSGGRFYARWDQSGGEDASKKAVFIVRNCPQRHPAYPRLYTLAPDYRKERIFHFS